MSSRAARLALAVGAVLAVVAFAALGAWQVHRLAWETALIECVEARLRAPLADAPARARWSLLTREADEYRRVRVRGRYDFDRETIVHASVESGMGYWVLTPMRTDDGDWVLVNRGFVPAPMRGAVPRDEPVQTVAGLLRFSEPAGRLLRANRPREGRWYSRDVAAIAAQRGLQGDVAPFFVDREIARDADRAQWPRAGLTAVTFPNNHLVYAVTWFALAAGLAAALFRVRPRRDRPGRSGAFVRVA